MRLGHYLKKLRTLPPGEVARRARHKAEERLKVALGRWRGYRAPTYALKGPAWLSRGLTGRFLSGPVPGIDARSMETCRMLCDRFLSHRFNLLGSGWIHVRLKDGSAAGSPINESNRAESARIRGLLGKGYAPIDWHSDFKSGHRWASDVWHVDLVYGSTPGADIKVPWELARMQHLAQFALAFAGAGSGASADGRDAGAQDPALAEACRSEFRDQILDFISANPPGFGVNWVCTMDVGIRIANWLVARDLFLASGAVFDREFEAILARSVYEHGRHILANLEWSPGLRGNHYYADIAGLAVAACALPSVPETDAWLGFAVREVILETEIQFLPDGANFEASTCYHRLSAEMAAYATAAVLAQPADRLAALLAAPSGHRRHHPGFFRYRRLAGQAYPGWGVLPFPSWYFERLERAAEFTLDSARPDGRAPQIGDNDSGRFLKLFPVPRLGGGGEEDFLDHRHLAAALNGFFGRKDFAAFAADAGTETGIVSAYLAGRKFPSYRGPDGRPPLPAPAAPQPASYPRFGLYVYRRPGFYLAFRCGPIGQLGNGGHAHNDQLSFELSLGGVAFLEDPGTYLYTPDWKARNLFRSTSSHNTLAVDGLEQNPWENSRPGLFSLISKSRAEMLEAGETRISGLHRGFGLPHTRILEFAKGRVSGADHCDQPGPKRLAFHFVPEAEVALASRGEAPASRAEAGSLACVQAVRNGLTMRIWSETGSWSLADGASSPAYGETTPARVAFLDAEGQSTVKWYIEWSE